MTGKCSGLGGLLVGVHYVCIPQGGSQQKDEHKAFLLGWKKYGNSWKSISTTVNMQTVMQGKSHAQYHVQKSLLLEKKARILEADAVGHQQHWDSLPPEKKARILEANAVGHQRYQESLPLEKKARILETNAVGHQGHRESLPPKKKARILEANAVGHQQY